MQQLDQRAGLIVQALALAGAVAVYVGLVHGAPACTGMSSVIWSI